ncbi:MAG: chlorophyll synthesis pathway protein BchC, partial [Pseudomonadota bacterium]
MSMSVSTEAIVIESPEQLSLRELELKPPQADDVVVEVIASGVSTGTERLLWSGRMPAFPGMGYPLVPGYEAVGRIVDAGSNQKARIGEIAFAPGANCYEGARGLFGAAARRLVAPAARVAKMPDAIAEREVDQGALMALAATARHALARGDELQFPDLIVGHGVLGRLIARVAMAEGGPAPVVWEKNPARRSGAIDYDVIAPEADERRDYRAIFDASGDSRLLDTLIFALAKGGEVVLAGFYDKPLSFAFPPAFMKEARLRVAAEWASPDLEAVIDAVEAGRLSLDGLITHRAPVADAGAAYRT